MAPPKSPSRLTLRGLDWLNFLLADVRTGVGPFLAIYLAGYKWDEERVGLALTVGGIAGILTQTPAGALVDRADPQVVGPHPLQSNPHGSLETRRAALISRTDQDGLGHSPPQLSFSQTRYQTGRSPCAARLRLICPQHRGPAM